MVMSRRELIILAGATVAGTSVFALPEVAEAAAPVVEEKAKKEVFFIPCLWSDPDMSFVEENTVTLRYRVMELWDTRTGNGTMGWKISRFKVGSPEYAAALAEHHRDPIPPHIQFGGAVVAGKGDPNFHSRWEQRTIEHLNTGRLV